MFLFQCTIPRIKGFEENAARFVVPYIRLLRALQPVSSKSHIAARHKAGFKILICSINATKGRRKHYFGESKFVRCNENESMEAHGWTRGDGKKSVVVQKVETPGGIELPHTAARELPNACSTTSLATCTRKLAILIVPMHAGEVHPCCDLSISCMHYLNFCQ